MHGFKKRIEKLEGFDTVGMSHVVLWGDGQPFADALGLHKCHPDATTRTLIHLQGVGGAAAVDNANDPEYAKAQAWLRGEDWQAL